MPKEKRYNHPWRYALAMFGLSIIGYMYSTYAPKFYSDLGMSMAAIGAGNVFFSIWDAFNDPIAGFLSDRTRSKWGRRKPWLIISVPLFVLSMILFFSPPASLGTGVKMTVYFTVFLMLTETANTISGVNYHSLLPELFREEKARNSANAIRQALQLVGMILGVSAVPMVAGAIGYQTTAIILGLVGGAMILYSILGCKEREDFSASEQPKLIPSLLAVASNKKFWIVAIAHFLYDATTSLLLVGIPFFVTYTLNLSDSMVTPLTACVFVVAIPAMFLWYKLINKWGTVKIWRISLVWLLLSLIPMYFANNIIFACIVGAFIGIGIAGVTANLDMVNSLLIEEDAEKYGLRREATYFAGMSFVRRLSGLIRAGVFFLMFAVFGFVSGDEPGLRAAEASRFLTVVIPIILIALSAAVSMLAKLKAPVKE